MNVELNCQSGIEKVICSRQIKARVEHLCAHKKVLQDFIAIERVGRSEKYCRQGGDTSINFTEIARSGFNTKMYIRQIHAYH